MMEECPVSKNVREKAELPTTMKECLYDQKYVMRIISYSQETKILRKSGYTEIGNKFHNEQTIL